MFLFVTHLPALNEGLPGLLNCQGALSQTWEEGARLGFEPQEMLRLVFETPITMSFSQLEKQGTDIKNFSILSYISIPNYTSTRPAFVLMDMRSDKLDPAVPF